MAEQFTVAIVGSGPGGCSAAARAAKLGVSHVLLEGTDHLSNTIFKYQKRKHVMAAPEKLPLRSDVGFEEGSREEVLGACEAGVKGANANVRFNAEVTAIKGAKGAFQLTLASGDVVVAENVVLAIGVQGNPRRLGVPGDDLPFVQYTLDDPDAYNDENIIVVGAGDAGIENALGLCDHNNVTLVNSRDEFNNAKKGNIDKVKQAISDGLITCIYNSRPKAVEPGKMLINTPEGVTEVKCDRIIARLGALPLRKFVESCGITFPSPNPNAVPQLSETYESNVPGLYVIGALGGYPLIKNCMNQGYEVIEFIRGNKIEPADEPLIQEMIDKSGVSIKVPQLLQMIRERLPLFSSKNLTTIQVREFLVGSELHGLKAGDVVFRYNDYTNSFYSILDGAVDIQVNPENPAEVVTLKTGDYFGEMGLISGRRRTATVVAKNNCLLLEVDRNVMIRLTRTVPQIRRTIDEVAIVRQIQKFLAPEANRDMLSEMIKTAELVEFKSGDTLIEEGASDDSVFLIRSGSVTVARKIAGRDMVLSYVPAGNYVGEMAMLTKAPRSATVKAAVATEAVKLDGGAFRNLMDRLPALRAHVEEKVQFRQIESSRAASRPDQGSLIQFLMEQGIGEATDVLLIDESLCVRCDNCEKACAETHHGVSRLNREAGPTFASIHVPTSCRHCEHPHCMKDCPADAIHRAPNGEVFIDEKCIGCGNCERNCPYTVIQMAAVPVEKPGLFSWLLWGRGPGPGEDKSAEGMAARTGGKHAVKCDMCKDVKGGPSCVRACPTGAAIRVNPEAFFEVMRERA